MRKTEKLQGKQRAWLGVLTLILVMALGLFADVFATVSHAQSQGKVIVTSAKIRKEASSTSEVIGSAVKDKVITINGQVQAGDGYVWYQTFVDSETLGYIRSDLVEITDGSTPTTLTQVPPTTSTNETPATVTAVNPISATVTGGTAVRVRDNASTTSNIVTTTSDGLALTVTGTATGSDGKTWYQVKFSANGEEKAGFIRSDFVRLSGELTPYSEQQPQDTPVDEPEEPVAPPEPVVTKDFDTAQDDDGVWYLLDNTKNQRHSITGLFDAVTNNAKAYQEEAKKAKSERVVIVILVLLLVGAAAAIAYLILKLKDMTDDAYFSQVENETLKRRNLARTQDGSQKVMHTVGAEKPGAGRPAGARPQGQRPAGAPQGQRPTGAPQGQRPAGAPQGQRPTGTPQRQRPAEQKKPANQQNWQSKNFLADDDDEFEFEFLNYDGEDEQ